MSEPELKRCPFCGGRPYLQNRHDHWRLSCEDCPVQIVMDTTRDCVDTWENRRAPAEPVDAEIRQILERVEMLLTGRVLFAEADFMADLKRRVRAALASLK